MNVLTVQRGGLFFYMVVCCTDCAIEIIETAKSIGLDITAEKLRIQQTVAVIANNGAG